MGGYIAVMSGNSGQKDRRAAKHLTTLLSSDTLANSNMANKQAGLPEWLTINLAHTTLAKREGAAAKHRATLPSSATLANSKAGLPNIQPHYSAEVILYPGQYKSRAA
jgi:hypothetical protein